MKRQKSAIACFLTALALPTSSALGGDPYCLTAWLKVFVSQQKIEAGRTNGDDQFAFHPGPFDRARSLLAGSSAMSLSRTLEEFQELKNVGAEYKVTFDVVTASGEREKVSGSVQSMTRGGSEESTFLWMTENLPAPSTRVVSLKEIDPKTIVIRRDPVPDWVLTESDLSTLARKVGIQSLTQKIRGNDRVDTLFAILKSGVLDARKATGRGIDDPKGSNFLELNVVRDPSATKAKPLIEFETKILKRKDYYINQGWDHGKYSKDSIRFDESGRIRRFLYQFGRQGFLPHELVVWAPISTSWIKHIYVSGKERAEVIRRLRNEGVSPPKGRLWEELLAE